MTTCTNYLLLIACIACAGLSTPAMASDLQDILDSKELDRYERTASFNDKFLASDKWFGEKKNFPLIFNERDGYKHIHLWFNTPENSYRLRAAERYTRPELSGSIRSFSSKTGEQFIVRAIVPHPRYEQAATLGLVDALQEFSPPQLSVEFTEEITIANRAASLHTLPEGQCQINMNLRKATLVTFQGNCSASDELIEFASKFSFRRFEMKLDT